MQDLFLKMEKNISKGNIMQELVNLLLFPRETKSLTNSLLAASYVFITVNYVFITVNKKI